MASLNSSVVVRSNPKLACSTATAAPKDALPQVYMETYGCQMNVLDTELVQGQLGALGYRMAATPQDAGIVLLNTCSVRELCEQKVWSYLGRLGIAKAAHKELIIGVIGCMAEREGENIFARVPHVDVVCGPANLDRLPTLLDNARRNRGMQLSLAGHTSRRSATLDRAQDGVESLDLSRATSHVPSGFQAYVRITRGCNKFCSFCVVPFTRGPELHRAPQAIVQEVQALVNKGCKEITLIGQTVNHYSHHDGGKTTSFADLLHLVHEQVPLLPRLRFLTSYPRDFGDDALDVMAGCGRICNYLHIPAQSGSNSLLKKMNRGYTVEQYLDLLQRARTRMPDICLAGDMIVGFPGETEADHLASIALLQAAKLKSCYVFKYSPRPQTVAARRLVDDVPEALKKSRNVELLNLQSDISLQMHQRHLGKRLEVLVEGKNHLRAVASTRAAPTDLVQLQRGPAPAQKQTPAHWQRLVGRSRGDEIVAFDGPPSLVGSLCEVVVNRATPLTLFAELPN
jgi:tRNA-2-methylthio-N6-dimethylallyladenosine synthase